MSMLFSFGQVLSCYFHYYIIVMYDYTVSKLELTKHITLNANAEALLKGAPNIHFFPVLERLYLSGLPTATLCSKASSKPIY